MKKYYNGINFKIIKFTATEDVLIGSSIIFGEEEDGNTTTIPSFW